MKYALTLQMLLINLVIVGCKTTDPTVKIAKDKSRITVFSSRERGSALTHAADSKQIAETAAIIDKKLVKEPNNVMLLQDRARIYLIKEDLPNARTMCNRALRLDLHNKKSAKLLGEVELADNNLSKAEIILYRLGGVTSKDPEIFNLLGLIALRRDQTDEAYEMFKKGLEVDSDNVAIRMNMGIINLKFRQMEEASKQFQVVLKSMPNHVDAKLHLGITKAYAGKLNEARTLYTAAIDEDADNVFGLYNLALLDSREGDLANGLKHVDRAIKKGGKEFSPLQMKLAEDLRLSLTAQIKQREEEEQKLKDLEKKKSAQEGKTSYAVPAKDSSATLAIQ